MEVCRRNSRNLIRENRPTTHLIRLRDLGLIQRLRLSAIPQSLICLPIIDSKCAEERRKKPRPINQPPGMRDSSAETDLSSSQSENPSASLNPIAFGSSSAQRFKIAKRRLRVGSRERASPVGPERNRPYESKSTRADSTVVSRYYTAFVRQKKAILKVKVRED